MAANSIATDGPARLDARREVGVWLKQRREDVALSQRDLAEILNIGYYTFISQIEAGRGRIPPERYEDWAKALSIQPREFVRIMLYYYEPSTYKVLFDTEIHLKY